MHANDRNNTMPGGVNRPTHAFSDHAAQMLESSNYQDNFQPSAVCQRTELSYACFEAAQLVKMTPEMFTTLFLYTLSIPAQWGYQLALPNHKVIPLSLPTILHTDTPEWDTHTLERLLAPVDAWQQRQFSPYQQRCRTYVAEHASWNAAYQYAHQAISRSLSRNGGNAQKEQRRLHELVADRPEKPRSPQMLYQNTSVHAVIDGLQQSCPMAGWVLSEITEGGEQPDLSLIHKAWQGKLPMPHDACAPHSLSPRAQVSPLLMTTPASLSTFMPRTGHCPAPFAESVFLDRRTLAFPPPTTSTSTQNAAWERLAQRLTNVLNNTTLSLHAPKQAPIRLYLTADAIEHWESMMQQMHTTIAQNTKDREVDHIPHDTYQPILAARLAALLTVAEDPAQTHVDLDTLKMGERLATISADTYRDIVTAPPKEERDAMELYEWLTAPEVNSRLPLDLDFIHSEGPITYEKDLWAALFVLRDQKSIVLLQLNNDELYVDLATPTSTDRQAHYVPGYSSRAPTMAPPPMTYPNAFSQGNIIAPWHNAAGYQPPSFQPGYHGV